MSALEYNPRNLPKLPVPKLKDTLRKYLRSLKPILNQEELCNTIKVVQEFECSEIASKLQRYLEKRAELKLNWLEEWWVSTRYLETRYPLTLLLSPAHGFPFENFNSETDRLTYAAKLILACATYKMLIDCNKILKGTESYDGVDMSQYKKIFGTCRIPSLLSDKLKLNPKSEHIVIAHKNHFIKLQLFGNGKPISERQILKHLENIVSQTRDRGTPIGILTTADRDIWANVYKELIKDNNTSVQELENCLFIVCLDDEMVEYDTYINRMTRRSLQLAHGGGSNANSANRWFDKTVQFVIGNDGIVGLTFDHAPCDGQTIGHMVDYIVQFIEKNDGKDIFDNPSSKSPERLCFYVNNIILSEISKAEYNLNKLIQDGDMQCFKFELYGKQFIKNQKLSPDSYIQMALQLALYRSSGPPVVQYEACSTSKYIGGRTESLRCCSEQSVTFTKIMMDCAQTNQEKTAALKIAVGSHKRNCVEAGDGYGTERHLLGLKLAAKDMGIPIPVLFSDLGYVRSTSGRLTTSQVATKCDSLVSFGTIRSDRYACCYNVRYDDVNFAIFSFKDNPDTNSLQLQTAVVDSLCDMRDVLIENTKGKNITEH